MGHMGALFLLLTIPLGAFAQERGEVVYRWEKDVSMTGEVRERTPNNTLMRELDQGQFRVDLDTLVDDRGRQYRMEADAWQQAEDGDVHYALQLIRYAPNSMNRLQRLESIREARPNWTNQEQVAFVESALRQDVPPAEILEVDRQLVEWREENPGMDQVVDVVVRVREEGAVSRLPQVEASLFSREPAFALRQMKRRLVAIEDRKTQRHESYRGVQNLVEETGGAVLGEYWMISGFEAAVTSEGLDLLAMDPRVERLELIGEDELDSNGLDDMREGAQMPQFHDAGYEGEAGSGRSEYNDMVLAIIDSDIDMDHPAWRDTSSSGSSRLIEVWRHGWWWTTVDESTSSKPSHGNKVAAIAVADLTQGQDPNFGTSHARDERTGFAPEASFIFIENDGTSITKEVEKAVDLGVDVINMSYSNNSNKCNRSYSANDAVDAAMLDGAFVAKSASNNGHTSSSCNVGNPGAASGAFTVNATKRSASDLKTAAMYSGSSRGGDSLGRSVIAITAPTGPENNTSAAAGGDYGVFGATSGATPVVAASAAVLKEHLMDTFSSSLVTESGVLYAAMLLMGDGQLESGSKASATTPMDELWGAGRLRMRMFNSQGMDTPWRVRIFSRTIDDGEVAKDMLLNPNSSGVNQAVPSDVDRFKATAFWHEPNVEDSAGKQASISLAVCSSSTSCYTSGNPSDPRQRVKLGSAVKGKKWFIQLKGLSVPKSYDKNYLYKKKKRNRETRNVKRNARLGVSVRTRAMYARAVRRGALAKLKSQAG